MYRNLEGVWPSTILSLRFLSSILQFSGVPPRSESWVVILTVSADTTAIQYKPLSRTRLCRRLFCHMWHLHELLRRQEATGSLWFTDALHLFIQRSVWRHYKSGTYSLPNDISSIDCLYTHRQQTEDTLVWISVFITVMLEENNNKPVGDRFARLGDCRRHRCFRVMRRPYTPTYLIHLGLPLQTSLLLC